MPSSSENIEQVIAEAVRHSEFAHFPNERMIAHHLLNGVSLARRRLELLQPFWHKPIAEMRVLDLGCGSGAATIALKELGVDQLVSFDLSRDVLGLDLAIQRGRFSGYPLALLLANGYHLPFPVETFDLCWCEYVVEHVADLDQLLSQAYRVLKPAGLMYILTNNAWWPYEPHSRLWWASWMPRHIAAKYARWRRHWPVQREWDIYLYSWHQLQHKLQAAGFEIAATSLDLLSGQARQWLDKSGVRWRPLELVLPNIYMLARKQNPIR